MSAAPCVWERRGRVFAPPADHPLWRTHATAPAVLPLSDGCWRVYVGGRDAANVSRIFAVDLDPKHGFGVVRTHHRPVLDDAEGGAWDAGGTGAGCVLALPDGVVRLYYSGIAEGAQDGASFPVAIGLAESRDGGLSFHRVGPAPVLARSEVDPLFVTTPFVGAAPGGGYEMWYASGLSWGPKGMNEAKYGLRSAVSIDGIRFAPGAGRIDPAHTGTAGLVRPWVTGSGASRRLWCSRRGHDFRGAGKGAYRIVSVGVEGRTDEAAIDVRFDPPPGPDDWDGRMQAYACLQPFGSDLVMLYNGDGFGLQGFGLAVLRGNA